MLVRWAWNFSGISEEILNAIMDASAAHTVMSKPALESQKVRDGLKDVLLGFGQLYEVLRTKGSSLGMSEIEVFNEQRYD
jgi:type I restriction enzyme R subunit